MALSALAAAAASGGIRLGDAAVKDVEVVVPSDLAAITEALDLTAVRYPVFNIPLAGWSEIEVKASTNNFNPASGGITNMAYWYESIGTNAYAGYGFGGHADVRAQLFYCNPDAAANGGRTWILATNALTLTEQIGGNGNYQDTVVFVPSLTVRDGSTNTWMCPGNDNLVWVYRRRNAVHDETNGAGRAVFHPVVPVQWRSTPLNARF
jgi:hypothetical protein